MSVSPADICRLTSEFTLLDGTVCQNIYHLRANFAVSQSDAAVLTALETWIEAAIGEVVGAIKNNVSVNLHQVDVVDWDGLKWEVVQNVGTFTPTFTFGNANDQLPNQVSCFATFNTLRPKTKGKKFLWGFTEDTTSASVIQSATVTAIAAFAAEVLDNAVIDVLNYLVPGVPRSAVDAFYDFTTAVVTNIVGSQRRRRPGVGE